MAYKLTATFLLFLKLCNTQDDYLCSSESTLFTDFGPDDCPSTQYYKEDLYGCLAGCVDKKTLNSPCVPNSDLIEDQCPPGLTCMASRRTCQLDTSSCMQYSYMPEASRPMWIPTCDVDGSYAPVQCKGEPQSGRCFCFSPEGERIFGQAWWADAKDMTCACSRRRLELEQTGRTDVTIHCDVMGNFEPLQCDSGLCWCADPKTGKTNSSVVPDTMMTYLDCYDATTTGSQYLRQCESQNIAQQQISNELLTHGTLFASFADVYCDPDGSYGSYQIADGIAYCSWKDKSRLGSWQSQVDNTISTLNCYCARDYRIYEDEGLTQTLICQSNGNYRPDQQVNGKFFCVDQDGFAVTDLYDTIPDCSPYA